MGISVVVPAYNEAGRISSVLRHVVASRYGTRRGVHSAKDWQGFAKVAAVAARAGQQTYHRRGLGC